ncbi:MAG: glycoside hydrolase family 28 protein [Bacteroidales bacterium]|nr:glycoside hydrolase family 28 protein [Bacteroidales bacterium]
MLNTIKWFGATLLFFLIQHIQVNGTAAQEPLVTEKGGGVFYAEQFGAVADGVTLNTLVFQRAIDEISAKGGGTLMLSKGKYLTGSLILKSDVTLFIDEGSVLLGSLNPEHYRKLEIADAVVSPKTDDNSKLALLLAHRANNMAIVGKGTIDGQGRKLALIIDSLHHAGVRVLSGYNKWSTRPGETDRPKIINFSACENVTVQGITLKNSTCWVQTYELCENLIIDDVKVESRAFWNNDGMDITDCRKVRITNCDINSADDGICLKSYYPGYYCDSIYIAHCYIRTSASAVKFGTASVGGFRNVVIDNITVKDTYRSAIAIESVDGGFIENVMVSNITAVNTGNAIFIRLGHRAGEKPGSIGNISFKNIKVQVPFGRPDEAYDMRGPEPCFFHNQFPSSIVGIPGHHIRNITLDNIEIVYPGRASKGMAYVPLWQLERVPEKIKDYPEYSMFGELPSWGFYVRFADGITMKNIKLKLDDADYRPAFVFHGVQGLSMEGIDLPDDKKEHIILKDVGETNYDRQSEKYVRKIE